MIPNPQVAKDFVQALCKNFFSDLVGIATIQAIETKATNDKATLEATIAAQNAQIDAAREQSLSDAQKLIDAKINVTVDSAQAVPATLIK